MHDNDKSKDGVLSMDEFIANAGDDKEWIITEKERFSELDVNKDGVLSKWKWWRPHIYLGTLKHTHTHTHTHTHARTHNSYNSLNDKAIQAKIYQIKDKTRHLAPKI